MKAVQYTKVLTKFGMGCAALMCCTTLYSQQLSWLGGLPGLPTSTAYSVSSDGTTVVGSATNNNGSRFAFRWTQTNGMENLGTLGGNESEATAVSANGQVIIGWAKNAQGLNRAFRWTSQTGMQDIGTLGGNQSEAWGMTPDGTYVVGWAQVASENWRPFRWSQNGGMVNLGSLGGTSGFAGALSADGSVVVGWARNAQNNVRAFRWTQQTGMQPLGTLGGPTNGALGVSADGSKIVGWAQDSSLYRRAFIWTAGQGMQQRLSGGTSVEARVVFNDHITYGRMLTPIGQWRAIFWDDETWSKDVNNTVAHLLVSGSYLSSVNATSPNKRFIVGNGRNTVTGYDEAYLLDTLVGPIPGDVDGDGCVDDFDLLLVLFAFGNTSGPEDINNDGRVDDIDLLTVLFNFGRGC